MKETNVKTKAKLNKSSNVAALVGKQCLIDCYIHGVKTTALWDTGSQVCIIDEHWKNEVLPNVRLRLISEIIDAPDTLQIIAANGQDIPYVGWIEVTFQLPGESSDNRDSVIPILVTKGKHLSHPIIGYNAIELILSSNTDESANLVVREQLKEIVKMTFHRLNVNHIQTFIDMMRTKKSQEYLVRTPKANVVIPKRTSVQIECRIKTSPLKEDTTLMFEPDINPKWAEGLEFRGT